MTVEEALLGHLSARLRVPVYMEEPGEGESYVVLERTGGGGSNHISRATFAVQSYAGSLYGAAKLNEEVKRAMDSAVELDMVSASRLNSDYNSTDPAKKKYRYQAVYDLTYYGGE